MTETPLLGLTARFHQDVPEGLAPIIGDVVHNLRSALDVMMTELIASLQHPSVRLNQISFPFWDNTKPNSKKNAFIRSQVQFAHDGLKSLLEAWEPFPSGKSRLFALNELWNRDKHRSIIPVRAGIEYSENFAAFIHTLNGEPWVDAFPVIKATHDGKVHMTCAQSFGPPAGTEVPCKCRLGLDGDAHINGRLILPELEWQIEVVSGVLLSFETGVLPTFLPPPSPGPVQTDEGSWAFPPGTPQIEIDRWIREFMGIDNGVS
jgi:hypothetical protein